MPSPSPYLLTPLDVLELRTWHSRTGFISDGVTGVLAQAPWITFILSTKQYALHSGGFTVAVTDRDELACALLRSERIEPGFCRRILDPACSIDRALVTPEEMTTYRAEQAAHAAHARLQRQADADEARRRRTQLRGPTAAEAAELSIDELFT